MASKIGNPRTNYIYFKDRLIFKREFKGKVLFQHDEMYFQEWGRDHLKKVGYGNSSRITDVYLPLLLSGTGVFWRSDKWQE